MSKTKRIISLFLILAMSFAILLSGCNTNPDTGNGKDPEPTQNIDVGNGGNETREKVKIAWFLVGPRQEPDTDKVMAAVNEYLKDKINIELDLKVFGYGDAYNQKVNNMLATGEKFDIAFTANWAADYINNANAGFFKPLDDFLAKDNRIVEVLGQDFLNGTKIDGKTFAVPTNKEKARNWGFLLNKEYVDKYNMDVSKVKSLADLEPLLKTIKDNEKEMIPLLSVQMEAPFKLLDWDNIGDDDTPGALYADNRDTTIVNQFTAPEAIEHYKLMRDFFQKGYLSPDAATMENFNDQLRTGRYFACVQSLKPGKAEEMVGSTGGIEWIQVDITTPVMTNRETTGALLAIPASSENAERAFEFITMLYTDKTLVNMLVYGIEGEHYEKVSDNVVTLLGGENSRYSAGNGWRFGNQFNNYLMDNEDPEKWVKFEQFNSKALPLRSLGFIFNSSSVESEIAACKSVVQIYYKQLFTGSVDVDATVAKMESEFKAAGIDKLLGEMQKQYDEWLEKNK